MYTSWHLTDCFSSYLRSSVSGHFVSPPDIFLKDSPSMVHSVQAHFHIRDNCSGQEEKDFSFLELKTELESNSHLQIFSFITVFFFLKWPYLIFI